MANADCWPFSENKRRHLEHANAQPQQLGYTVLSIVMTNLPVLQARHVRKFAHLKAIPRGEHHFAAPVFQFLNNGPEKWHVRRVFQVDPDLAAGSSWFAGSLSALEFQFRRALYFSSVFVAT